MNRLMAYFRQSGAELRKVVWPSRKTATQLTLAVVIFSLVLAVIIGIMDYLYAKGLETLIFRT